MDFLIRPPRTQGFQLCRLLAGHAFINVKGVRWFFLDLKFVGTHDDLFFGFGGALVLVRGLGDFLLGLSAFDGFDHASHGVELAEVVEGAFFHIEG